MALAVESNIMEKSKKSEVFVEGVPQRVKEPMLSEAIRTVFLKASDHLSWLKKGETVLLKPALNSPDSYPATTHPLSVKVVADCLAEHGAKVVIGDQSGIEHVLHGPKGVLRGSTQDCFAKSGMGKGSGYGFVGFEQGEWDKGFFKFESDRSKSWPNGFFVTEWIRMADHIVSLPRVSTHAQAGVTLGFKNMVGLLREDSRMEFHANGPFNAFIRGAARGGGLSSVDDRTKTFFEKMVEISLAIQGKLRCTLFTATKAQVTIGPDRRVGGILRSKVVTPETGLVFASQDPVAAEVFALAFLTHLSSKVGGMDRWIQKMLLKMNGHVQELSSQGLYENRFVRHALRLGMGRSDFEVDYAEVPEALCRDLDRLMLEGRP
jgi:uncharacterized protein (DUF362 family)